MFISRHTHRKYVVVEWTRRRAVSQWTAAGTCRRCWLPTLHQRRRYQNVHVLHTAHSHHRDVSSRWLTHANTVHNDSIAVTRVLSLKEQRMTEDESAGDNENDKLYCKYHPNKHRNHCWSICERTVNFQLYPTHTDFWMDVVCKLIVGEVSAESHSYYSQFVNFVVEYFKRFEMWLLHLLLLLVLSVCEILCWQFLSSRIQRSVKDSWELLSGLDAVGKVHTVEFNSWRWRQASGQRNTREMSQHLSNLHNVAR